MPAWQLTARGACWQLTARGACWQLTAHGAYWQTTRQTGILGKLTMAFVERVFSGVQPTGNLHLGNYRGAIVNFVKLQ